MSGLPCTCGGIAPGYPYHEDGCAISLGHVENEDAPPRGHSRRCTCSSRLTVDPSCPDHGPQSNAAGRSTTYRS